MSDPLTVLSQDYFTLFDLPETFVLDEAELEQRYFALQRLHHPDRAADKVSALRITAYVNDAYKALKSPLLRAEYMLSRDGIMVNTDRPTYAPTPEILQEAMEMREALQQANGVEDFIVLQRDAELKMDGLFHNLTQYFSINDKREAAYAALRMRYLSKWLEEVAVSKRREILAS